MTNGRWTLLTAVLLVVVAFQWSGQARPASGAGSEPQSQGRFQIATAASNGKTTEIYVLNTMTSEVWMTSPTDGTKWHSMGAPVKSE